MLNELIAIGNLLKTQDNRCTQDPIFLVQEEIRVYGIDSQYSPEIAWLYEDECIEVPKEVAAQLEQDYQQNSNYQPEGYTRVGYKTEWSYVQAFFTEAAADRYIKEFKHHHRGKLRTYADSLYHNPEMRLIREYLLSLEEVTL